MLSKRVLIILLLLIAAIGTLSAISANDLADEVSANTTMDEIGIEDNANDLSIESDEVTELESDGISGDALESPDDGTFTSLQNKINGAGEGSTITLENDYYYNADFGSTDGVQISKSLTINGKGHAIDGLSTSKLLQINGAKTIVLKNISFRNGVCNQHSSSVVFAYNGNHVELNGCNFENNIGMTGGAVILWQFDSSSVVDCTFNNNSAVFYGGAAVLSDVISSSFEGCSFKDNYAGYSDGGAVYLSHVTESHVDSCNFTNNFASNGAGALIFDSGDVSFMRNCIFENNSAKVGGAVLFEYSNSISVDSCRFTHNLVGFTGGAVYSQYLQNASYVGCSFNNNGVDNGNGGAIFSENIVSVCLDSCNFANHLAYGVGGVVYAGTVLELQADNCNFSNSTGYLGGAFFALNSVMKLKNLNVYDSTAYSSGGVVYSNNSDVSIDNCFFKKSFSMKDSGGIIYNYKGNLDVIDSSFIYGFANYGGAIANVESNLTVSGSKFINNSAKAFGGAIYHIYGTIDVDDSLFNNSIADVGSAISCMMSYSLSFTDNIFLNSTKAFSAIDCVYSAGTVVESGNHFEDIYHVVIDYVTQVNGEQTVIDRKAMDYIASNTGTYLNDYGMDADGNYKEFSTIDFGDYPNDSKIFGNYNVTFLPKYFYLDNQSEIGVVVVLYHIYDDYGHLVYGFDYYDMLMFLFRNYEASYNFTQGMFDNYNSINQDQGSYDEPVSLINSFLSESKTIPSAYDSRDYGYITSVKNQGNAGNCWAFAGIATLEACVKKATGLSCDYSEDNAKNLMAMYSVIGLNLNTNNGGYDSMLMAYLTSWLGPINEISDSYGSTSILSSYYKPLLYVQNIKFLPARKNNFDNDLIKRAIMDYGAVAITFYIPDQGYHAVSLVGWNDNYNGMDSIGSYTNGAWIFKNSWGTEWGDNGFGYLSYNTMLSSDSYSFCHAYTLVFNKNDDYVVNHQYDNAGVSDYLYSEGHIFYKNKFTCKLYSENLAAFSTYFKNPTNYKVSLYKNGKLVLSQSGYSDAGYYTIPFNKVIEVEYGDEYEVMIENCNSGENCFPVCQADELNMANFKENTSFFSYDGEKWFDLFDLGGYHEFLYGGVKPNTCQVACIKVFTRLSEFNNASIIVTEFDSIDVNEEVTIGITVDVDDLIYSNSVDGSLVSLNINGKDYYAVIHGKKASLNVSFDEGGDYKLSAQYKNNLLASNIAEFNFKVNKLNTVVSASSVSKVYGGSESSVITLKDDNGNLIRDAVVTFTLNGHATKIKTNANGQAVIPITLAPKSYVATVSFDGSGKYNGAAVKISIVVKKASARITAKKLTLKAKKTKKYSITLKDNAGRAIKKAKVTLKVKGKTYKATTNANGKATFKVKFNKKASLKATIKFAGNAYYNSATKKVKITVKR